MAQLPATFTLTIAPSTTRLMERQFDNDTGSKYKYEDSVELIELLIRHGTDGVDKDGFAMSRHNAYVERTVFATPTTQALKYTTTHTVRYGTKGQGSPAAAATLLTGMDTWLNSGTIAADFANGGR